MKSSIDWAILLFRFLFPLIQGYYMVRQGVEKGRAEANRKALERVYISKKIGWYVDDLSDDAVDAELQKHGWY